MRTVVVIPMQPVSCHDPTLLQAVEGIAVQHLGAVGPVESFRIGMLGWLSWLDVIQGNPLGWGPLGQRMCDELKILFLS